MFRFYGCIYSESYVLKQFCTCRFDLTCNERATAITSGCVILLLGNFCVKSIHKCMSSLAAAGPRFNIHPINSEQTQLFYAQTTDNNCIVELYRR